MNIKPTKPQLLRLLPDALVLTRGPRNGEDVYLSFDDGPHPEHTPALLDLLEAHGSHASFFLVGRQVERYPELVRRIVAGGHTLGNHSYSHSAFDKLSLREQLEEIDRTDRLLAQFDGHPRHGFRPPRGNVSLSLLLHFACSRRSMVYWSYNSLDYLSPAVGELVQRLRSAAPAAGDIVLLHDDDACAHAALSVVLPDWKLSGRVSRALPLGAA
jgi:peptidoglycan-N-acetylglucosamine deacetylase